MKEENLHFSLTEASRSQKYEGGGVDDFLKISEDWWGEGAAPLGGTSLLIDTMVASI